MDLDEETRQLMQEAAQIEQGLNQDSTSNQINEELITESAISDTNDTNIEGTLIDIPQLDVILDELTDALQIVKSPIETTTDRLTLLSKITDAVECYYPNLWDLQKVGDAYYLYILFSHVTISNKDGLSEELKNLYMRLRLRYENGAYVITSLEGTRSTLTYAQYVSKYVHSHLSNSSINDFSAFCLGNSPLNTLINDFNYAGINNDNIMNFELLLQMLQTLAEWESIEGTPYKYIKNIKVDVANDSPSDISNVVMQIQNALVELPKEILSNYFTCSFSELDYELNYDITDEFEKWALQFVTNYVAKTTDGVFYNPIAVASAHDEFLNTDFQSFMFKDNIIVQHVEQYESIVVGWPEGLQKYIHRDYMQLVMNMHKDSINKIVTNIRNKKIKHENERNYTKIVNSVSRNRAENYIPMFPNT